jgi:flagellar biosynthetic protein FliP
MNGEHGGSIRGRTLAVAGAMLVACAAGVRAQSPSYPPTLADEDMAAARGTAAPGAELTIPDVSRIIPPATDPKGVSATLQILVLLTVLTLVPSILVMTTSFPRVLIVLALLRQAVGTQQLPPGQVLLALSLFVTALVMAPTWQRIHAEAAEPYFNNEISQEEAFDIALAHMKDFMYRQIEQADNHEDVYLFLEYAEDRKIPPEEQIQVADVPMTVMVPAFMISELKTAFIMGFRIYLPFLVIDMVIATILISMGMMMLPPVLISLPFKILLFVLADGWHLVVESLLYSFA